MNALSLVKQSIPRTIGYTDLATLYEENKGKIYMTEKDGMGKHKLDESGFKAWTDHLKSLHNISEGKYEIDTYIKFAEALHAKMRYVTFPEYMRKIQQISAEIIELIENNEIVFFVVSGEAEKSNTWTTLLYFGELQKLNLEAMKDKICIIHDSESSDLMDFAETNKTKKIVVVHYDDMSYSGVQMGLSIPWDIKERALPNFSYYIGISFITKFAQGHVGQYGVKFFKNTELVPDFEECINEYYKTQPDVIERIKAICSRFGESQAESDPEGFSKILPFKRGHNAFQCYYGAGQSAIYFDHKIADHVSVLSTLFSKGTYPPNININSTYHAVLTGKNIYPLVSGSLISTCDAEDECYKTFYKRYTYTFNGQEINSSKAIISEIERIKSKKGGARKSKRARRTKHKSRRAKR